MTLTLREVSIILMQQLYCVNHYIAGYRLVGDVDYSQCKEVASLITPVSE